MVQVDEVDTAICTQAYTESDWNALLAQDKFGNEVEATESHAMNMRLCVSIPLDNGEPSQLTKLQADAQVSPSSCSSPVTAVRMMHEAGAFSYRLMDSQALAHIHQPSQSSG
jgi:hypothetical protein